MVIKNLNYEERKKWYIKTYSELAIQQMKKYKIPASIILAQGMVESSSGSSNLALKSNNHFDKFFESIVTLSSSFCTIEIF